MERLNSGPTWGWGPVSRVLTCATVDLRLVVAPGGEVALNVEGRCAAGAGAGAGDGLVVDVVSDVAGRQDAWILVGAEWAP